MWKAHAILALCLFSVANAKCPTYQNCADCLNTDPSLNLDCGWCSPDPAFFANGSTAFQCMDHTSQGWYCNNLCKSVHSFLSCSTLALLPLIGSFA